jgi:hypothetical protein
MEKDGKRFDGLTFGGLNRPKVGAQKYPYLIVAITVQQENVIHKIIYLWALRSNVVVAPAAFNHAI